MIRCTIRWLEAIGAEAFAFTVSAPPHGGRVAPASIGGRPCPTIAPSPRVAGCSGPLAIRGGAFVLGGAAPMDLAFEILSSAPAARLVRAGDSPATRP